jgi:hypothetical protein
MKGGGWRGKLDLEGSQTNDVVYDIIVCKMESLMDDHPKPEPVCQFKPFLSLSFLQAKTKKKQIKGGGVKSMMHID